MVETVYEELDRAYSPFYQCKLETHYVAPEANFFLHPVFETGVVKVYRRLQLDLSEDEKSVMQCLWREESASSRQEQKIIAIDSNVLSMEHLLSKQRKKEERNGNYINCDFFLGSVAEVERLLGIVTLKEHTCIFPIAVYTAIFCNVIRHSPACK